MSNQNSYQMALNRVFLKLVPCFLITLCVIGVSLMVLNLDRLYEVGIFAGVLITQGLIAPFLMKHEKFQWPAGHFKAHFQGFAFLAVGGTFLLLFHYRVFE
jgi:hypothetical protein